MNFNPSSRRGFTLIEVMIVVAIVSLLASVVLFSMQDAHKKSRDAQRISDIEQLQLAFKMYNQTTGSYPTAASGDELGDASGVDALISSYVTANIKDPLNTGNHKYYYNSNFLCQGVPKKVIYAKTMERSENANWMTECGTSVAGGTNTFGVILR